MRYHFPYVGADLCLISPQPDQTQSTLQDCEYGLVYHAMCLFTPQLSLGTHRVYSTHGGMAQIE